MSSAASSQEMRSTSRNNWISHYRQTITLAIPLIIGQVAMIAIWTSDFVMMGWISADALAAGTQANRLYQPLYFIAIGLTIAISPPHLTSFGRDEAAASKARGSARHMACGYLWDHHFYSDVEW